MAPLSGAKLWVTALTLALANFVVVLDTTIANVSVPHIAGSLAVSPTQGTWAITSYAVADAISVPLTGWLSARFGSVRWFIISLIGFGAFSLLCGLSTSLGALIAFRIGQGLAGGPLMPLSQTLLMSIFPREKQGAGIGLWAATTTAAPIFGPILGGTISDNLSWPWLFFINLPIVALAVFALPRLMKGRETEIVPRRIDLVGLALMVLSIGAFQLMIDTGRELDWFGSTEITVLAVVAVVAFALFVIWELTEDEPIVDIRVFRHRGFAFGTLALSLGYGAFFSQVVLTPLWLQSIQGYTATQSGYVVAWVGVLAVLLAPVAGRMTGKPIDIRITITAGLLWFALCAWLRTGWSTEVGYWTLALPHLLTGAGMPFFFIGLSALILNSVRPEEVVSAAGISSFLRTLSGAIGTASATTYWDTAAQVARSEMVGRLNGGEAMVDTLGGIGLGRDGALAMIDRLVDVQAYTISVDHAYAWVTAAFVLAALAVWMVPRVRITGGSASH